MIHVLTLSRLTLVGALLLAGASAAAASQTSEDFYRGRAAPPDWLPNPNCEAQAVLPSKTSYKQLAACHASRFGMPPALAHAVIEIESRFNPDAKGADGEVGLMQIMPATARLLGFRGSLEQLAAPAANIPLGVRYLAQAYQLAGGDLCTTVMKYRAGHRESRFSVLSVRYCEKARAILTRDGQPVVGAVPVATFGFNAFKNPGVAGGGAAKGVCTRRVLVPGPRYMKCAVYGSAGTAKRMSALRARLF